MSTPNPTANPTPASNPQPLPSPPRRNNGARRLGLGLLALVILLAAIGYAFYWFGHARYFESTDDAYVNGDVVQVSSEQPGTVLAVQDRKSVV